jgi:CRP-like cAMP-binding protein
MDSPLFRGLSAEDVRQILDVMVKREFEVGEVILQQATITNNVWVLVEGECEIVREPPSENLGKTVHLAKIAPYETFGEMSFIENEPHVSSVWAATDVTTIKLRRDDFLSLTERRPACACRLACNLVSILSDRLRRMDEWVTRLLDEHETAEVRQIWSEVRDRIRTNFPGQIV